MQAVVVFFLLNISLSVGLQSSLIRAHPEFPALVAIESWARLHTLRAGSSGYSASFLAMRSSTLIIVVGASVSSYDFDNLEDRAYCCLHPGRPLILHIYLSSPAFNFVAMSSYDHFCFLQHIRPSACPYVSSSAVLPSAEGSLRDALAETCYLYAQNLPIIVTLLPRAALALALLL